MNKDRAEQTRAATCDTNRTTEMNAAKADQSKATPPTPGRNQRDGPAVITVRERIPGEVMVTVRFPKSGKETVILSGPHFDTAESPCDSRGWFGRYLSVLPGEIDWQAQKLGFDEFEFWVSLPHCNEAALYSVRHDRQIRSL